MGAGKAEICGPGWQTALANAEDKCRKLRHTFLWQFENKLPFSLGFLTLD